MDYKPFNPLDRENLAASIGEALLEREPQPLGELKPFYGAGVYVIYYAGDFPAYQRIAEANLKGTWNAPIYVGKAIPKGGRKGVVDTSAKPQRNIYTRLNQHAESIRASENLDIKDFFCRFLVVEDIWIPLGESLIINRFAPVWNTLLDGFGNHNPGKGRYDGLETRWDVLHPGRAWAKKCKPRSETPNQIAMEVEDYLASRPVGNVKHLFNP